MDAMRIAWLFPGQGSQYVGMGRSLVEAYPTARETFAQADEVLGDRLSEVCFAGPESTLIETVNTQPAILTHSVAVARVLEEAGAPAPIIAAGHSLGEYSALVAAGVLKFADALRLVRSRGAAMQAAVPTGIGGMAAIIGLDREAVEDLCRKVVDGADLVLQPANLNGTDQVVVAGHRQSVEAAVEAAEAAGAKRALMLPVGGPFHCRLMEPAGAELAKALEPVALEGFRFPVVANVTAEPVAELERVKELLVRQVDSPVQWLGTMDALVAGGIDAAVEVGPGRVLSGLLRRHARTIATYQVDDPAGVEKTLAALAA
jgi:[acyl-carrier-protein] S-malonyltransferase